MLESLAPNAASVTLADYVGRNEALALLGVKPQTLYSYVSRGLIRRLPGADERTSYYNREDLQRLRARSIARSGHGPAAASAMHWGEPVLLTAITEITQDGPRYRQRLAVDLAKDDVPFEAVAEFLWSGQEPESRPDWSGEIPDDRLAAQLAAITPIGSELHIRQVLTETVLLMSIAEDWDMRTAAPDEALRARRLLCAMTGAFGMIGPARRFIRVEDGESIAHALCRAMGVALEARHVAALNAALVLVADHEFTPATFAARIAASVGCDLYSCIGTALQVQFGSSLGLRCDKVEQLLAASQWRTEGIADDDHTLRTTANSFGFSHPLYGSGDPRSDTLLALAQELRGKRVAALKEVPAGGARQHLTLDEALVVFCRALGVARHAASGLFALGRAAGWIAHVFEQSQQGFLIRPRGKFIADPRANPGELATG